MDLAFLLIATLVLLVQEPTKNRDFAFQEIRSSYAAELVETDVAGESLYLYVERGGAVSEIQFDGKKIPLKLENVNQRIQQMDTAGNRVVVICPESDALYAEVAMLRDILAPLELNKTISHIYELSEGKMD